MVFGSDWSCMIVNFRPIMEPTGGYRERVPKFESRAKRDTFGSFFRTLFFWMRDEKKTVLVIILCVILHLKEQLRDGVNLMMIQWPSKVPYQFATLDDHRFLYVRNNLTLTSYESLGRGGITPFYHQFYGKYDFRVSNFEFQGQRYQAESKRR